MRKNKKTFGFSSFVSTTGDKNLVFKEYHESWRETNSTTKASYAPIFSKFKEKHLKDIEPGPLKLYLFFAFAADNAYGHSWYSIEAIADFFGAQKRTIDKWIKVLVERNLIYREQKGKRSSTTYLIPYSDTLIRHQIQNKGPNDGQKTLNVLVDRIKGRENVYGEIVDVLHMFQWKVKNGNPVLTENIQWLFVITKRDDDVLTSHYTLIKESNEKGISEDNIEDIATFESPYQYLNSTIQGVALQHEIKLSNSNAEAFLKLSRSILDSESWDWNEYPNVEFGRVDEFWEDEPESNQT